MRWISRQRHSSRAARHRAYHTPRAPPLPWGQQPAPAATPTASLLAGVTRAETQTQQQQLQHCCCCCCVGGSNIPAISSGSGTLMLCPSIFPTCEGPGTVPSYYQSAARFLCVSTCFLLSNGNGYKNNYMYSLKVSVSWCLNESSKCHIVLK